MEKRMSRDGNDYMQQTGRYRFFVDGSSEMTKEQMERLIELQEKQRMEYVNNLMENDKDCKSIEDKILIPTGNRVIVLPYDNNPYRIPLHVSKSGLILGDTGMLETHKDENTGEIEENKRGIWCCKVIAVGNKCETVCLDEDVYINFAFAAPLPFGGKGYYAISENNVICSIRKNEKVNE